MAASQIRFAMLGSGSGGNATVIQAGSTQLMVDCGFSAVEAERRLARLGLRPEQLAGVLVTHEHNDHLSGVGAFARRHRLPVWLTAGTATAWRNPTADARYIDPHRPFQVGEIEIQPYPVPHDAREPTQFVFAYAGQKLGLLSDTGHITPHINAMLDGCDGLLLECNHDPQLLQQGPYPPMLKQRVGGDRGHLSNAQAAGLLRRLDRSRLRRLVLIHLSETNNTPAHALAAISEALDLAPEALPAWIECADQAEGMDWRGLDS